MRDGNWDWIGLGWIGSWSWLLLAGYWTEEAETEAGGCNLAAGGGASLEVGAGASETLSGGSLFR
jgi:hypothetical protein